MVGLKQANQCETSELNMRLASRRHALLRSGALSRGCSLSASLVPVTQGQWLSVSASFWDDSTQQPRLEQCLWLIEMDATGGRDLQFGRSTAKAAAAAPIAIRNAVGSLRKHGVAVRACTLGQGLVGLSIDGVPTMPAADHMPSMPGMPDGPAGCPQQ